MIWALDVYPDMCIGITDDITITAMCVLFVSVCIQVLNVFSMSLLENDLYVINYQNHSIVKIHRYDPVRPAALVSGTFGSPNIIKVHHQVRQPQCAFTLIYSTLIYSTLIYSTLIYSHLLYSHLLSFTLVYSHLRIIVWTMKKMILTLPHMCHSHTMITVRDWLLVQLFKME